MNIKSHPPFGTPNLTDEEKQAIQLREVRVTFITWLWSDGWRQGVYSPAMVRRMRDMLQATFTYPHRFVCVTDHPFDGVECIPLPELGWVPKGGGIPRSYFKLWAFSREAAQLGDILVSIDLDAIVLHDLAPLIVDAFCNRGDHFQSLRGVSCPYNTSLFALTAGAFPEVWENLNPITARQANQCATPDGRKYYGSDQAVVSMMLPNYPTWGAEHGLFQYASMPAGTPVPLHALAMFFAGPHKPWDLPQFSGLYWSGQRHWSA